MDRVQRVVDALLDRHGTTFAAEAGIDVANTPAPLFQLLCLSILVSARIRARAAMKAARALFENGWTTVDEMAESTWAQRTKVLNEAGYARYDESTSRGDIRRLRDEADRDPDAERVLLRECKGIGDVGVDVFFREVRAAWAEIHPFVDERARRSAGRLDLPDDAHRLAALTSGPDQMVRLVAALVRTDLTDDHDDILAAADRRRGRCPPMGRYTTTANRLLGCASLCWPRWSCNFRAAPSWWHDPRFAKIDVAGAL